MALHYNVESLQRTLRAKAKAMRVQVQVQTPSNAATYIQAQAVALAPRHSGETIRGITKKRIKAGHHQVISKTIPKGMTGFMQNFWANRTEPFRAVRMTGWPRYRGRKVSRVPLTRYGDGTHTITGTPEFFHRAAILGRRKFRKLAISNVRVALREGA